MMLHLRTLTPLWFGGLDPGRLDRLHETGLAGSIRWWYEVILRGLGAEACDPLRTGEGRCGFKRQAYDGSEAPTTRGRLRDAGLCDACQLFGAQDYGGRLRVALTGGDALCKGVNIPLPSGRVRSGGRPGGWYVSGDSMVSGDGEKTVRLQVVPLASRSDLDLLKLPLVLAGRHAAMGAKTASGYGVVRIEESIEGAASGQLAVAESSLNMLPHGAAQPNGLADLREHFFAKFQFLEPPESPGWWQSIPGIAQAWAGQFNSPDGTQTYLVYRQGDEERNERLCQRARIAMGTVVRAGIVPMAPAVRNWLRFKWLPCTPYLALEKRLFGRPGTATSEAVASKIAVSYAYSLGEGLWEFRVWGWIPLPLFDGVKERKQFLDCLRISLSDPAGWKETMPGITAPPSLTEWHEMENVSDDGTPYLRELLGLQQVKTL